VGGEWILGGKQEGQEKEDDAKEYAFFCVNFSNEGEARLLVWG